MQKRHKEVLMNFINKCSADMKDLRELYENRSDNDIVYEEVGATIGDFKNLIYKLSEQNKILKSERDELLHQVQKIQMKLNKIVRGFKDKELQGI